MKQEFVMTEAELQAIYDISRNQTPVIFVGVWTGLDNQERANKIWQVLGEKYGFEWDTAEPSGKGDRYFLAIPKPTLQQPETMQTSAIEYEINPAYKYFAEAHPNDAYESDPEKFWQFFHQEHPTLSREIMVRFLRGTEQIQDLNFD
jgi:hypothetical protein